MTQVEVSKKTISVLFGVKIAVALTPMLPMKTVAAK